MATRSKPQPPICKLAPKFVKARFPNSGSSVFAPMTGQDSRAFDAFVHLLDCYAACDDEGRTHCIAAMHCAVACMQEKVRFLAKAAIPCALDWSHEEPLWTEIVESGGLLDTTEIRQLTGIRP